MTERSAGVQLLGGEMLAWSDLDGKHGPGPVGGAALAALLSTGQGHTLVVGPHDPDLLDALPATELTVLVRGVRDAENLAARYADRPAVQVCCGSPEKLAALGPYDTVVALDGLARLSSVEGPELAWGEAFDLIVSVLRPGGRLLLGVENFLGLHRLLALPPESTDSDWSTLGEHDETRPAGLTRVRNRVTAAGLWIAGTWAAYPSPLAPTALLGPELLADGDVTGFLQATLGGTGSDSPMLADPARSAGAAVRHGVAAELAPGWVLLAERVPAIHAAAGQVTAPEGGALPAAVLVRDGRLREVHRDPAGGWWFADGGPVPPGRTVEDLVVAATLRRDLPAVRALLGGWQAGAEAGVPADQVVVTPPVPGTGWRARPSRWRRCGGWRPGWSTPGWPTSGRCRPTNWRRPSPRWPGVIPCRPPARPGRPGASRCRLPARPGRPGVRAGGSCCWTGTGWPASWPRPMLCTGGTTGRSPNATRS
ncbi:hypothetical protein ACQPYA_28755 [Micromonospora sp. CA-263727]|uniref:hypothetical protein n=1 Tax=Micromonospora sp. CA-263727 TaxID=3239967 RepID=UPI003D8F9656